jgi:hypothetical protein
VHCEWLGHAPRGEKGKGGVMRSTATPDKVKKNTISFLLRIPKYIIGDNKYGKHL